MRIITGERERASTVSGSGATGRVGRRGGVLLVLTALGCTVTGDDFEPVRVVPEQTETEGLEPPQAPSLPAPSPAGNAPVGLPTPDEEDIDPNGALDPADMVGNASGAGSAGSVFDAGADAGVEGVDAGASSALDAGTSTGASPTPPDASAGSTEPDPTESELDEPTADEPEPSEPEPSESDPDPTEPEPSEPEPPAPCPGVVFDQSCYQFSAERVSWRVAEDRCVAWGGHLASVDTFEEDAFIGVWPALLGVPLGDGSGIWLGGTDEGRDGDFRWADERPLSFVGWAPQQPDNGQGVDCIQKRNDGTGRWYDLRCSDAQAYVCEQPH